MTPAEAIRERRRVRRQIYAGAISPDEAFDRLIDLANQCVEASESPGVRRRTRWRLLEQARNARKLGYEVRSEFINVVNALGRVVKSDCGIPGRMWLSTEAGRWGQGC